MSETAKIRFLPWVRAGAATAIAAEDELSGSLAANAALSPWVTIAGHDAIEHTAMLRGPGHVTALGAQTIVKMEPIDGTQDFERNYFSFVELRPADLPWRYTPASPGRNNQLRPWLVLVVVREQEGVSIVAEPGAKLPVLRIEAPALPSVELPDLGDSAAWAHVQTAVPVAELAAALDGDASLAVARLMCPRYLDPDARWMACLVPAFDVGVHAGLGEAGATALEARPAWDHGATDPALDETVVRLPVYHHWSFSTGPSGDFELLARRLEADEGETRLGRVDLDITDPGPPLPEPPGGEAVAADFVSALRSPGVERRGIPVKHRQWLNENLESVVELGARRPVVPAAVPAGYDPARDDPVVAPPLYGAFQADRYAVPADKDARRGWLRDLNLRPELRAIAGLGAAVVRRNQESLMASAWAQAGAIRDAQRLFDQGRLAAEIGRSIARRVRRWAPGALLQATQRMHAWVDSPASSNRLAVDLNTTKVPTGLVSSAFARATRPRGALGRAWASRASAGGARAASLSVSTETFLAATGADAPAGVRAALDFAETSLPAGAWTQDAALEAVATLLSTQTATRVASASGAAASAARAIGYGEIIGPEGDRFDGTLEGASKIGSDLLELLNRAGDAPAPLRKLVDLSAAATSVSAQLDPLRSIQNVLVTRIPALSGLLTAEQALPGRLVLHPVFTDPLYRDLARLDARYVLAEAETMGNNKVTLLDADDDFVAAFLAGANHEMSRELIWREFPASAGDTFFHRFWDTGAGGADDIGDISRWDQPTLGRNLSGVTAAALSVILVRGDLLWRYPEAHVYLTQGRWNNGEAVPDAARVSEPLLQGRLDRRTVFFGFALSTKRMRGNRSRAPSGRKAADAGWFVTIEEPAHGPRFGLDAPADDGSDLTAEVTQWRALTWGHLVADGGTLADLRYAVARTPLPRANVQNSAHAWGHNAAHMAAITWQRPFRLYIHADRLLPGPR